MTKQDRIDQLNASSKVLDILAVNNVENVSNTTRYDVFLLMALNADEITKTTIALYVIDEGGVGEAAYYGKNQSAQVLDEPTPIKDAVVAHLDGLLGTATGLGTFTKYENLTVNEDKAFAKVDAIFNDGTNIVEKKFFLWNDGGIQFKPIS